MPVDVNTWRERNGLFNLTIKINSSRTFSYSIPTPLVYYSLMLTLILFLITLSPDQIILYSVSLMLFNSITITTDMLAFFFLLLKPSLQILSGDIELNPGDRNHSNLKVCHWNSIVYLPIISLKYQLLRLIMQYINLTSSAFLKHFLTHQYHLIIPSCP